LIHTRLPPRCTLVRRNPVTKLEDSRYLLLTLPFLNGDKVLNNPALLHKRIQHVEYRIAAPNLRAAIVRRFILRSKESYFLFSLLLGFGAPDREGLELIDEFVDDIPEPLVWQG
jgi:hypothetical protein